jgi:alkylation response protein AidB-like acyl-CoA dehydrogenase
VARAIVTAARPDSSSQMLLVPMDVAAVRIDPASWRPMGMEASESFAVSFEGVRLDRDTLVGEPGDYERAPWFGAGASRFLAVQTGALERLRDDVIVWLARMKRGDDPIALTRLGEIVVAAATAERWVAACADAWSAYAADPNEAIERSLIVTVDAARAAIERAALDVAERVERTVGARGLLEPEPFGRWIRDLRMYLRQPAPDAAVLRVARAACGGVLPQGRMSERATTGADDC